jgi:hypothetical protein
VRFPVRLSVRLPVLGCSRSTLVEVVQELRRSVERISSDPLPAPWRVETGLDDVGSFGALVSRIRRLDARSDAALRALARLSLAGEREACLVVTAALLPLLIVRCDRDRALIDEAVNELASRMAEPATEPVTGGVANRLLDRVAWRVRHPDGERRWQHPTADPTVAAAGGPHECFETEVVDRLALAEFRRRLVAEPGCAVAWSALVDASGQRLSSSTERTRLAKHRRMLRPLAYRSLVA